MVVHAFYALKYHILPRKSFLVKLSYSDYVTTVAFPLKKKYFLLKFKDLNSLLEVYNSLPDANDYLEC